MASATAEKSDLRPRVLAVDCEMVGYGPRGKKSDLARISIVNRQGRVLLDCLVRPVHEVTDWRTHITGITAASFGLEDETKGSAGEGEGEVANPGFQLPSLILDYEEAITKANNLLDAAVVVGHDLRHDFKLLRRFHHKHLLLRDTAFFPMLKAGIEGGPKRGGCPSLKNLAIAWLDQPMHGSKAHDSVEDARTAMLLYRLLAPQWEAYARRKFGEVPPEFLEKRGTIVKRKGKEEGHHIGKISSKKKKRSSKSSGKQSKAGKSSNNDNNVSSNSNSNNTKEEEAKLGQPLPQQKRTRTKEEANLALLADAADDNNNDDGAAAPRKKKSKKSKAETAGAHAEAEATALPRIPGGKKRKTKSKRS